MFVSKLHTNPVGIFAGATVVVAGAGVTERAGCAAAGVSVHV